jgi:hypothetical protein
MSLEGTDEPGGVLELFDQLEELVSGARRVPLSASVVLNEDDALELIDRARLRLPDELVAARHTVEDRARIIAEAQREADATLSRGEQEAERLVHDAEARAAQLVDGHAVTAQARAQAAALVTDAEAQAAATRAEADGYAREVMVRLEDQLARTMSTVRKGIEALPPPPGARRRRKATE